MSAIIRGMATTLPFRHPNLFKTLMAIVFVNFLIGVALIFGTPQDLLGFSKLPAAGIITPLGFWGIIFIVTGLMILIGSLKTSFYKVTRMGLIASAAVGGFWGFGFVIQFYVHNGVGISPPILWIFYSMICITASSEPTANPLSQVLQNDIHTTLQTKEHLDHILPEDLPTNESRTNGGI